MVEPVVIPEAAVGVKRPWVHRLSNVDRDNRTADCAACGENVAVKVRPNNRVECKARVKSARAHEYIWKKYQFTTREWYAHFEAQGGVCKICKQPQTGSKDLCVDHCHKTGVVRGLLCNACNLGLGMFRDRPDLLLGAVEYLER